MIPRHSNPHRLLHASTIVSRSLLDDLDEKPQFAHNDPDHARIIQRLETILKRSIEDVLPTVSEHHAQTDSNMSPKKKRRRKLDVDVVEEKSSQEGVEQPRVVSFRLLSGTSQPKSIILAPRPAATKYMSQGPALEDTETEAEQRAVRTQEIAVDFAWIMNEATRPHVPPSRCAKMIHVVAAASTRNSSMILVERPKSPPKPPRISLDKSEVQVEPSPHVHETTCCPIVEAHLLPTHTPHAEKRKRRRGKQRDTAPIQPTFWRPPPDIGGKSLGYAWGYAGSRPSQAGEATRYERDTMRKAVFA